MYAPFTCKCYGQVQSNNIHTIQLYSPVMGRLYPPTAGPVHVDGGQVLRVNAINTGEGPVLVALFAQDPSTGADSIWKEELNSNEDTFAEFEIAESAASDFFLRLFYWDRYDKSYHATASIWTV